MCTVHGEFAAGVYSTSKQLCVVAVTDGGALYSWGDNSYYSLGQNHGNPTVLAPTLMQQGLAGIKITQVSCGLSFSLALSNTGQVSLYSVCLCLSICSSIVFFAQVYSWGYNGHGELGNGTTANSSTPIKVNGKLDWLNYFRIIASKN